MGKSALCRWRCDCPVPLNRRETGGHITVWFLLLLHLDLAYFYFQADVEWHIESKPTPLLLHFEWDVTAKDPFLKGLVHC